MTALPKPKPEQESRRLPQKRKRRRPKQKYKKPNYGAMTLEITLKVLVNGLISAAALTALTDLLPYHIAQKTKLEQIQQEVHKTRKQLEDLRKKFDVSFSDPQSALNKLTLRVPGNHLRIVFDNEPFNDH